MLTTLRYIWALLTLVSCAAAASITGIVYLRQGETRTPLPNVRVSARSPQMESCSGRPGPPATAAITWSTYPPGGLS